MTADQHLKTVGAATDMHGAIQNSPEMAAGTTPPPTPPPPAALPTAGETPPLAVVHNGRQIVDPHIAMAHHNIRSLIDGGQ